jgi:hypothetical protein
MTPRKPRALLVLLSLVAGFAGGIASRGVATSAHAQGRADVIEATEFRLVSETGDALGTFKVTPRSGSIVLFDRAGQIVWTAPQAALPPLGAQ